MGKITKIILLDNLKNKVVIAYFVLLALISWTSMMLQDNETKGALTILNVVLFIAPLMSMVYTVIYLYDSRDFLTMLLCQPLRRRDVWQSLYVGCSVSLLSAFLLGAGIPIILYGDVVTSAVQLLMGCAVTLIFTSLAFLIAMLTSEKTRGIGASLLLWLLFTMIYDAVLLFLVFMFSDYPIEQPLMGLLMLNPLDLARFQVVLKMDVAAMMGYSGALFKDFLGDTWGMIVSSVLLLAWIILPYAYSQRLFSRKDL
ncbi:ABC transporter permease subunit [Hallella multisaccharivorax]|uniref:ABC transporter permease subunit n=1 Tax=Hallella multisaccharivorax TaxID=310514 RepID=UPI00362324C2